MPSSVAVSVSNAAANTSSAKNPFALLAGNASGAGNADSAAGLFLSLLGLNGIGGINKFQTQSGADSSTSPETALSADSLVKSGVKFDSALLVLPQGLANLSESDLQTLLDNATQNADGSFANRILVSLTPGTPAADAIAKFLAQLPQTADAATLSQLTTTTGDATANGQILLIATNLTPADMEALKKALSEQGNTIIDSLSDVSLDASGLSLDDATDNLDGTDASTASNIALVMFVATPAVQPKDIKSKSDDFGLGLSALTDSSTDTSADLTDTTTPTPAHHTTENKPSPFATSDEDSLLGLKYGLDASGKTDTGNARENRANPTAKIEAHERNDVAGKVNEKAIAASGNFIQSWQTSTDTPITADGAALAGTTTQTALQSSLTNPIINNAAASGTHPATQMVAAMLEKANAKAEKTQQTLTIELDPPELGRVQVQLSYEKGEAMKVHVLTESKDAFTLLQRDSHALRAALEQAGVQTDSSSLSFDMAGSDQSFNQMLGQFDDRNSGQNKTNFALDMSGYIDEDISLPEINTSLDFIPDAATGNVRYSLLV